MPLQATSGAASQDAFGGNGVAVVPTYIEEVFSTWLYTGTGAALTITNNIDLSTKGGLVWLKDRDSGAKGHGLFDTARGVNKKLQTPSTAAEFSAANQLTAFNTTGFALGTDTDINGSGTTYASWTFREQPKFFDVVTFTKSSSSQVISHNLNSTAGCIFIKRTDSTGGWLVAHRGYTGGITAGYTLLNATNAFTSSANAVTAADSTSFTLGSDVANGNFVAYLFAHDAGGFGLTGTDNVISCGTFTTDGAAAATVSLGYEPQWVLFKRTDSATNGDWVMFDNMRGLPATGTGSVAARLIANTAAAESPLTGDIKITSTGFVIDYVANSPFIYIAIRRGPMKVPTTGTSVFSPVARTGTGAIVNVTTPNFAPDLLFSRDRGSSAAKFSFNDKLRGPTKSLYSTDTAAEATTTGLTSFNNLGYTAPADGLSYNEDGDTMITECFQRSPSFMDVVCYTGTGSATTFSHNLQAVPELMLVKRRSTAFSWTVYSASLAVTEIMVLNTTAAIQVGSDAWNSTRPTASVFSVSPGSNSTNASGSTYVAYLFATCAGVSKVFSYTGNGSSQTINCGFTSSARFVLIKRTDSTGDWYVWDTTRGIVAGNDPHLSLNTTAAEVTTDDTIDTNSTGFVVNQDAATDVNVSSATYIGLAIA